MVISHFVRGLSFTGQRRAGRGRDNKKAKNRLAEKSRNKARDGGCEEEERGKTRRMRNSETKLQESDEAKLLLRAKHLRRYISYKYNTTHIDLNYKSHE